MIPHRIHQTWKTRQVPAKWEAVRQSWGRNHPLWEYRFWSDHDLRALVARDYPAFLPIYDGYPENIMRADAARCLVLHRYGGVYADLDLESLQPLDAALEGRTFVIAPEPAPHAQLEVVTERGFQQLLCNAFMASTQAHPFLDAVIHALVLARNEPNVLNATGAFLLTRLYESYPQSEQLTILPSELIYPLSRFEVREPGFDPEAARERYRHTALTIHYWMGSWVHTASLRMVRRRLARRPN